MNALKGCSTKRRGLAAAIEPSKYMSLVQRQRLTMLVPKIWHGRRRGFVDSLVIMAAEEREEGGNGG